MVLAVHLVTIGLAASSPAPAAMVGLQSGERTIVTLAQDARVAALAETGAPGESTAAEAGLPLAADRAPQPPPPPPPQPSTPPLQPPLPVPRPIAGLADPLEGFNRVSYAISQPIDRFVLRPVALAYKKIVPHPFRDGIRNAIANLRAPIILVNDVAQLRPRRALHTLVRFVLNTLIGAGGLFDVARRHPFSLPGHPNGFADTLGYYGVGPGFYVYLPVLGPSSLRDGVGGVVDLLAEPHLATRLIRPGRRRLPSVTNKTVFFGQINFDLNAGIDIASGVSRRAEYDEALEAMRHQSVDPYATLRASYQQDRAGEIAALRARKGRAVPAPELDDPLSDPAAAPPGH